MVNWTSVFHAIIAIINDILLWGGLFFSGAAFGGEFRNVENQESKIFRMIIWPAIMFFIWWMIIPPIVWTVIQQSRKNQGS